MAPWIEYTPIYYISGDDENTEIEKENENAN